MKTSRKVVGLCAQSGKYREQDCERKWQECLRKHDGRTTIASFYKMAQDAGVDLSAIARQFPSKPSNPHCSFGEGSVAGQKSDNSLENTLNKDVMPMFNPTTAHDSISPDSREGMREVRVSEVPADESEAERRFRYSETFSDKLTADHLPSLLREVMDTQQGAENRDKVMIYCQQGCCRCLSAAGDAHRMGGSPPATAGSGGLRAVAERNIPKKTADRYLGEFTNKYHLTLRIFNGRYRKNIPV